MGGLKLVFRQLGPLGHVLTLLGFLSLPYQFSAPLHAVITGWNDATHGAWQTLADLSPFGMNISDRTSRILTLCALSIFVMLSTKPVKLSRFGAVVSSFFSLLAFAIIFTIAIWGVEGQAGRTSVFRHLSLMEILRADYIYAVTATALLGAFGIVSGFLGFNLRNIWRWVLVYTLAVYLVWGTFGNSFELAYERKVSGIFDTLAEYRLYTMANMCLGASLTFAFATGRSRTFITILIVVAAIIGADHLVTHYPLS